MSQRSRRETVLLSYRFKDAFTIESDRHWDGGEDPSLLDPSIIIYKRKGYAVATDEQLARIEKVPKREFIRRGINQHTLEKICNRVPVRSEKLAKCLKVLEEYEEEQAKEKRTLV